MIVRTNLGGDVLFPASVNAGDAVVFSKFDAQQLKATSTYRDIPGYSVTIMHPGIYRVTYVLARTSETRHVARASLMLNGTTVPSSEIATSSGTIIKRVMDIELAEGDVLKMRGEMAGGDGSGWPAFYPGFMLSILAPRLQAKFDQLVVVTPTT